MGVRPVEMPFFSFLGTEKLLYKEMGVVLNLTCEQVKEYIIQKIKPDSRFN